MNFVSNQAQLTNINRYKTKRFNNKSHSYSHSYSQQPQQQRTRGRGRGGRGRRTRQTTGTGHRWSNIQRGYADNGYRNRYYNNNNKERKEYNPYVSHGKHMTQIRREMNQYNISTTPSTPSTSSTSSTPSTPSTSPTSSDNEIHENILCENERKEDNSEIYMELNHSTTSPITEPTSSSSSDNEGIKNIENISSESETIDYSAIVAKIELKYKNKKKQHEEREGHKTKHKTPTTRYQASSSSLMIIDEDNEYNEYNEYEYDDNNMDEAEEVLKAYLEFEEQLIRDKDKPCVADMDGDDIKQDFIRLTDKNVNVIDIEPGDTLTILNSELNQWEFFQFDCIDKRNKIVYYKTTDGNGSKLIWIQDMCKENIFLKIKDE